MRRGSLVHRHIRAAPRCRPLPVMGLAALLFLTGCSARLEDPFVRTGDSSKVGPGERYRVAFDVSCGICMVSWQVGPFNGRADVARSWSHSLWVSATPTSNTLASITAIPASTEGSVSWVRVAVDGKMVAYSRGKGATEPDGGGPPAAVAASTPIPPPDPGGNPPARSGFER